MHASNPRIRLAAFGGQILDAYWSIISQYTLPYWSIDADRLSLIGWLPSIDSIAPLNIYSGITLYTCIYIYITKLIQKTMFIAKVYKLVITFKISYDIFRRQGWTFLHDWRQWGVTSMEALGYWAFTAPLLVDDFPIPVSYRSPIAFIDGFPAPPPFGQSEVC